MMFCIEDGERFWIWGYSGAGDGDGVWGMEGEMGVWFRYDCSVCAGGENLMWNENADVDAELE